MRMAGVLGAVILVVAAWLVPLPLHVVEPARLVAADTMVKVTISEQFIAAAALRPEPVDGAFLGVRQVAGPSLVHTVAAGMSPARHVLPRRSVAQHTLHRPEVLAAVLGLGLSPGRLEDAGVPVTVHVADTLDPGSLGVVLHAFDATSALDVARGRRVVGIGVMAADQTLGCPVPPEGSLAAASDAGVDIVLVAQACGDLAPLPGPRVVTVATLTEAVDVLLAGQ